MQITSPSVSQSRGVERRFVQNMSHLACTPAVAASPSALHRGHTSRDASGWMLSIGMGSLASCHACRIEMRCV
jgi:hypothetical protein